jgi:hypothetical protein
LLIKQGFSKADIEEMTEFEMQAYIDIYSKVASKQQKKAPPEDTKRYVSTRRINKKNG